ncbi:gephyrin-like molybdotransferase Glp [Mycolicibacter hiberniae]|uniref:Molybdopterin molybdenumtransferase n=1 Tax=Mycolicibacter hiberniae TaxID=29314 RepID=A0A7I7XB07_9MYCO|nr:gephyrin-like molybdotransferase Glp [Mycolicibacter hiberniae]MCV7087258.1 molybdopterin molybdotransferase MoeA [Mycolicibacter hiberniae]ORV67760.1 molybdopterin molybdenumtransferase [Mycolicibacter hiberniae]BBZ25528.1 molybdopterin molybdenumtransferase [Mycolicibacter hiberniae]
MRSVEEHQRAVADLIRPRPPVTVALSDAEGLALAADVIAPISLPVFDNSGMDGYAVLADDVAGATPDNPVTLPVTEDIPAGRTDIPTLTPGSAHRIMTGAPVPHGADGVIPVEATDGGADVVRIGAATTRGRHIRPAGSDVSAGATVLRAGQLVNAPTAGLAAALGLAELPVQPRQRVLVISTGSELVEPGTPLAPGQIYESNGVMLSAAVREAGAEVVATATVADDTAAFTGVLERYGVYDGAVDLVITSGGVSAGAYEVVKDVFGRDGDQGVHFVKVAMQPGMPQGIGRIGGAGSGAAIITLPGNPVSAQVSFEVFVRPALRRAMNLPSPDRPRRNAVLREKLISPAGKRQFRRGLLDHETATVTSYGPPASHHLRYLASANCLLDIADDVTELPAGAEVQVWDLTGW